MPSLNQCDELKAQQFNLLWILGLKTQHFKIISTIGYMYEFPPISLRKDKVLSYWQITAKWAENNENK